MTDLNQKHSVIFNLGDILQLPAHGERSAIVDLRDESRTQELSAFELDALCNAVGRGLLRRQPATRIPDLDAGTTCDNGRAHMHPRPPG